MVYSMSGNGRVAAVAPHGVLFRGASEGRIRKSLIDKNLIDAVIGLPENLFYGTSIPACIIVFRKGRTNTNILFIDASKQFKKDKAKNALRDEDIKKIVDTYKAYKTDTYESLPNECRERYSYVASLEDIKKNEYNLNIPRYVDTFEEEEIIDIDIVNSEISELKKEIAVIEAEMEKYLEELGLK